MANERTRSAPMCLFDQVLGIPWGAAGLGHGSKIRAHDKFAVVEKNMVTVFHKFAELDDLDAA